MNCFWKTSLHSGDCRQTRFPTRKIQNENFQREWHIPNKIGNSWISQIFYDLDLFIIKIIDQRKFIIILLADQYEELISLVADGIYSENIEDIKKAINDFQDNIPESKWTQKDRDTITKAKAHLEQKQAEKSIFSLKTNFSSDNHIYI